MFRPVNKAGRVAGSRLTARSMRNIIKDRAAAAGIEERVSGHSLRVGLGVAFPTHKHCGVAFPTHKHCVLQPCVRFPTLGGSEPKIEGAMHEAKTGLTVTDAPA